MPRYYRSVGKLTRMELLSYCKVKRIPVTRKMTTEHMRRLAEKYDNADALLNLVPGKPEMTLQNVTLELADLSSEYVQNPRLTPRECSMLFFAACAVFNVPSIPIKTPQGFVSRPCIVVPREMCLVKFIEFILSYFQEKSGVWMNTTDQPEIVNQLAKIVCKLK